jgi:hypothetical protein
VPVRNILWIVSMWHQAHNAFAIAKACNCPYFLARFVEAVCLDVGLFNKLAYVAAHLLNHLRLLWRPSYPSQVAVHRNGLCKTPARLRYST